MRSNRMADNVYDWTCAPVSGGWEVSSEKRGAYPAAWYKVSQQHRQSDHDWSKVGSMEEQVAGRQFRYPGCVYEATYHYRTATDFVA